MYDIIFRLNKEFNFYFFDALYAICCLMLYLLHFDESINNLIELNKGELEVRHEKNQHQTHKKLGGVEGKYLFL
jgi:hypothetical protein